MTVYYNGTGEAAIVAAAKAGILVASAATDVTVRIQLGAGADGYVFPVGFSSMAFDANVSGDINRGNAASTYRYARLGGGTNTFGGYMTVSGGSNAQLNVSPSMIVPPSLVYVRLRRTGDYIAYVTDDGVDLGNAYLFNTASRGNGGDIFSLARTGAMTPVLAMAVYDTGDEPSMGPFWTEHYNTYES